MHSIVSSENIFSPLLADLHQQELLAHYCEKLRREDGHALGFVPFSAFGEAMRRNRMIIELENAEPAGFLIWTRKKNRIKILMIAIQKDARRIFHATNLITGMLSLQDTEKTEYIQLRCADDLESNRFWQAVGFDLITQVDGGKLRSSIVRPKTGTTESQIMRALGKKTLMKIKRKKCKFRRINIYRLWIEKSDLWTGHKDLHKLHSFASVGG